MDAEYRVAEYRVAAAISNADDVENRFGLLDKIRIYDIAENLIITAEDRTAPRAEDYPEETGGCPGKKESYLNALGSLLADCDYFIIGEIGGYPSRVLQRYGINVLEQQGKAMELLYRLREYIMGRQRENEGNQS